ncbi:MAG TPA: hybrid sensor histidine kinase/response regulator [Chroococcidiopsis sp.]
MFETEANVKANILVVDDHPDNLRTLSLFLQVEGYKVRKAASGSMALETVGSQLPDLILLDIRMPKMDGFEVCAALKRSPQTSEVPILFISASDEVVDKVRAFEMGGSDYITKPFRSQEVLARVKHQLTIRQQRQELFALYQQVQSLNAHLEQQVQERTQALQQALEELQRINQVKDDFLSTISHELRTPMTNICVALQLLMTASRQGQDFFQSLSDADAVKAPNKKIMQYLSILQTECDRELQLIQDLLDLQQVTAATLLLEPTLISLDQWLPLLLKEFHPRAQRHQQTFTLELPPDLPLIETDAASLSRIIIELLNNACKYTPAGGAIALTLSFEGGDPAAFVFSVSNTGTEISAEELPRVFDKFYRIPSRDPWRHGGTGLGLALVKKLVEHLEGSITVSSADNHTCFTLKLPTHVSRSKTV